MWREGTSRGPQMRKRKEGEEEKDGKISTFLGSYLDSRFTIIRKLAHVQTKQKKKGPTLTKSGL